MTNTNEKNDEVSDDENIIGKSIKSYFSNAQKRDMEIQIKR